MSPDAQRIAIAEACGWLPEHGKDRTVWWTPSKEKIMFESGLPDYLNDLNAMHEAEKTLKCGDSHRYYLSLVGIASTAGRKHVSRDFSITCATAAQRAQAFLRTIGKWPTDEN